MNPLTDDERVYLGKAMEEWDREALIEALLDNASIEWLRAALAEEKAADDLDDAS